jgi:hypothetical protein
MVGALRARHGFAGGALPLADDFPTGRKSALSMKRMDFRENG